MRPDLRSRSNLSHWEFHHPAQILWCLAIRLAESNSAYTAVTWRGMSSIPTANTSLDVRNLLMSKMQSRVSWAIWGLTFNELTPFLKDCILIARSYIWELYKDHGYANNPEEIVNFYGVLSQALFSQKITTHFRRYISLPQYVFLFRYWIELAFHLGEYHAINTRSQFVTDTLERIAQSFSWTQHLWEQVEISQWVMIPRLNEQQTLDRQNYLILATYLMRTYSYIWDDIGTHQLYDKTKEFIVGVQSFEWMILLSQSLITSEFNLHPNISEKFKSLCSDLHHRLDVFEDALNVAIWDDALLASLDFGMSKANGSQNMDSVVHNREIIERKLQNVKSYKAELLVYEQYGLIRNPEVTQAACKAALFKIWDIFSLLDNEWKARAYALMREITIKISQEPSDQAIKNLIKRMISDVDIQRMIRSLSRFMLPGILLDISSGVEWLKKDKESNRGKLNSIEHLKKWKLYWYLLNKVFLKIVATIGNDINHTYVDTYLVTKATAIFWDLLDIHIPEWYTALPLLLQSKTSNSREYRRDVLRFFLSDYRTRLAHDLACQYPSLQQVSIFDQRLKNHCLFAYSSQAESVPVSESTQQREMTIRIDNKWFRISFIPSLPNFNPETSWFKEYLRDYLIPGILYGMRSQQLQEIRRLVLQAEELTANVATATGLSAGVADRIHSVISDTQAVWWTTVPLEKLLEIQGLHARAHLHLSNAAQWLEAAQNQLKAVLWNENE